MTEKEFNWWLFIGIVAVLVGFKLIIIMLI